MVDEAPEGVPPVDLPAQPSVFAPCYAPEEIAEIAQRAAQAGRASRRTERRGGRAGSRWISGDLGPGRARRSASPCADPAEELAEAKGASITRLEWRRCEPGALAHSGQQLGQCVHGRVHRRPRSSSRAREVSITGTASAMSSQPGSDGCRRSLKVTSAAARTMRAGSLIRRACIRALSSAGPMTGSAARLNAPRASPVRASRYAVPTSRECTAWKTRRSTSGTSGTSSGRISEPGRNGPAKSRRISEAASREKIRPGRKRTTRTPGFSFSNRSRSLSTATLSTE